jgi:hypothetical protein
MLIGHKSIDGHNALELPFGYYLELDADLLILRRSEGTFVAAFSTRSVDLFEVELMAWGRLRLVGCGPSVEGTSAS